MIKKYKKIILILFFFIPLITNATEQQQACLDYEIAIINNNNINDGDYIISFNKNYNEPYNVAIGWTATDCEQDGDFSLKLNSIAESKCSGGWNNKKIPEVFIAKELQPGQDYDFYFKKYRNDRGGIWEIHLCYYLPNKKIITEKVEEPNILFGKQGFFETRDDFIAFLQIQGWFFILALIIAIFYKITTLPRWKKYY